MERAPCSFSRTFTWTQKERERERENERENSAHQLRNSFPGRPWPGPPRATSRTTSSTNTNRDHESTGAGDAGRMLRRFAASRRGTLGRNAWPEGCRRGRRDMPRHEESASVKRKHRADHHNPPHRASLHAASRRNPQKQLRFRALLPRHA